MSASKSTERPSKMTGRLNVPFAIENASSGADASDTGYPKASRAVCTALAVGQFSLCTATKKSKLMLHPHKWTIAKYLSGTVQNKAPEIRSRVECVAELLADCRRNAPAT